MNDSFIRTTSILTEHFSHAPIAVVDDVINAVNQVLYTVTDAMEDFLKKRLARHLAKIEKTARDPADYQARVAELPTVQEIELGTAKMETLLETKVDEKFDLFELDALRNVFNVAGELVEGGWFKLAHHTFDASSVVQANEDGELDREIERLEHELFGGEESLLRQQQRLKLELSRLRRIDSTVERYSSNMSFLSSERADRADRADGNRLYRDVVPLAESLQFLVNSVKGLEPRVQKAKKRRIDRTNLPASARDHYLETVANQAVLGAGMWSDLDEEQVRLAAEFTGVGSGQRMTLVETEEVEKEVETEVETGLVESELVESELQPELAESESQAEILSDMESEVPETLPETLPESEDSDKENIAPGQSSAAQTVPTQAPTPVPTTEPSPSPLQTPTPINPSQLPSTDLEFDGNEHIDMFEMSVD